jgi:hypothetical protein
VLGRDPALRVIAERDGWRQLGWVHGLLRPLSQIALDGTAIDDLLIDEASAPIRPAAIEPGAARIEPRIDARIDTRIEPVLDRDLPNVLPFPIAARPAGAR